MRVAPISSVLILATSVLIAGCGGGATIGSNPGPIAATASPASNATPPATVTTTPPTITPATPGPGSTSGATPAPAATSGANAKTPASCVANSTPAPIAVGSSLGMGQFYGAWGATVGSTATAPTNGSVRDMALITLSGSALRIRLINPDTANPLVVCAAYVGVQKTNPGPALVAGSSRQITFNGGQPGITLPPNTQYAYSDPVAFDVKAQEVLGVSLYLSASTAATAANATWNSSYATASGAGDETRDETGAGFTTDLAGATFDATFGTGQQEDLQQGVDYALAAIDVLTNEANGSVVMLGSSTFQGYESEQDEYDHVVDLLGARINNEIPSGMRKGLVNMGLGGDSLYVALAGRFARDVFTQTGVTGVALYDINDLDPQNGQTYQDVEANYMKAAAMAHAHHIRVFCSTWAPESLSDAAEAENNARSNINAFILNSGVCDDTVDWATTLSEPGVPLSYNPAYFSDSIHANAAGHMAISQAVPLTRWFEAGSYP